MKKDLSLPNQVNASKRLSGGNSPARLETRWTDATDTDPNVYELSLTNRSDSILTNFTLCFSQPCRVDAQVKVVGGELVKRISNHTEIRPPNNFRLASGATWKVEIHNMHWRLHHWSDGVTSAYLAFDKGDTVRVDVGPARNTKDNKSLKTGTRIIEMPDSVLEPLSIIPWPNGVKVSGRRSCPQGYDFSGESANARSAKLAFEELSNALFPVDALARSQEEGGLKIICREDETKSDEGYGIIFSASQVTLCALHKTGFLYGMITLGQILRGAQKYPQHYHFPERGEIQDSPNMPWRGSHLDVARQFYSGPEVAQFLRVLAWNKMNHFHWHLADDEAWRVEIDAYPQLTEMAAWRGHNMNIPPLLGSGPEKWGGFYTKASVRKLVAQAGSYGIEVVPEIDVPGHCYAMQEAIPELRDPNETGVYYSVQGFPNNCLNLAHEPTFYILEKIFDELIELFPSKIFHIGADEVPLGAWSGSPLALKYLEEFGGHEIAEAHRERNGQITNKHGADDIDGTGAAILQAQFLKRVQGFLASRGCIMGGWEEAAHSHVIDKAKTYLVGWRNKSVSSALASEGYNIVVSPGQAYYLDMSQSTEWSEPGAWWAGHSSAQHTYEYDPVENWTEQQKKHLLGVQACIWSEPMTNRAIFDRLIFPRLSAIAETGWTTRELKSWPRFEPASALMPNMYRNWGE